jgi:arginine exporter protein ArgO
MPIDTPIKISCTAVRMPAPEKIDSEAGTGARGATSTASASVSTILTWFGMVFSLAIGAAATKPPMRRLGHHSRPTHCDTSTALMTTGCIGRP